jgi:glutamine synthetase
LGDELTAILDALDKGEAYVGEGSIEIELGVDVLPHFPKDTTDRNRTSPFAFTGNKFEFRMLGSSLSIAGPNIVLNTIVAEELEGFADILEKAGDFKAALQELAVKTIRGHKRILFNGNGYDESWVREAEERGLLNIASTPEALPCFVAEKNIALFTKHKVFTKAEMESRYELLMENYCKLIAIEAETMIEMIKKDIVPAAYTYLKRLSETSLSLKQVCPDIEDGELAGLLKKLYGIIASLQKGISPIIGALEEARALEAGDIKAAAMAYRQKVVPAMEAARVSADELEANIGEKYWPYPTYGEMLFYV